MLYPAPRDRSVPRGIPRELFELQTEGRKIALQEHVFDAWKNRPLGASKKQFLQRAEERLRRAFYYKELDIVGEGSLPEDLSVTFGVINNPYRGEDNHDPRFSPRIILGKQIALGMSTSGISEHEAVTNDTLADAIPAAAAKEFAAPFSTTEGEHSSDEIIRTQKIQLEVAFMAAYMRLMVTDLLRPSDIGISFEQHVDNLAALLVGTEPSYLSNYRDIYSSIADRLGYTEVKDRDIVMRSMHPAMGAVDTLGFAEVAATAQEIGLRGIREKALQDGDEERKIKLIIGLWEAARSIRRGALHDSLSSEEDPDMMRMVSGMLRSFMEAREELTSDVANKTFDRDVAKEEFLSQWLRQPVW